MFTRDLFDQTWHCCRVKCKLLPEYRDATGCETRQDISHCVITIQSTNGQILNNNWGNVNLTLLILLSTHFLSFVRCIYHIAFLFCACSVSVERNFLQQCCKWKKKTFLLNSLRHTSSCPRQQRSASRCFSCCRQHWRRHARTPPGPASLRSTPGWAEDTLPAAVCLRTAGRFEAAVHPLRLGSVGPCRGGAETSRCACSAC